VDSAKLRLYKPLDYIQKRPVEVEVYAVSDENGDWIEGSTECAVQKDAATWQSLRAGRSWTKEIGSKPLLDMRVAPLKQGKWMEFDIPASLVQRWLDDPAHNAGLYIKARNNGKAIGDHVYFYSSEHYSGKYPQLVIEGSRGPARSARIERPFNKPYEFPKRDAQFENWLATADNRYTEWVKVCKMTPEQSLLPYYWEVIIRGEFLLPRCRLPLSKGIDTLDRLIEQGDEAGVRTELKKVREYLLVWEYIRETRWYDSGPVAEELSPYQLAQLWNHVSVFQDKPWKPLTAEELDKKVLDTIESTREKLELTPEAAAIVDPIVEIHERLENFYVERFKEARDEIQGRLERGEDDTVMLDNVRRLHENHELFLYHQSTFNTPRWTAFMENAKAIPLAKMYLKARRKEYNAGRIGRNLAHATKYGRANKHVH